MFTEYEPDSDAFQVPPMFAHPVLGPGCNEITTPAGVCTPPTEATSGRSPVPRPGGTARLIWYRPAPVNPANAGVKPTLLTTTLTGKVDAAAPENACPAGTAGLVGPNPVANNSTMSPGFDRRIARAAC